MSARVSGRVSDCSPLFVRLADLAKRTPDTHTDIDTSTSTQDSDAFSLREIFKMIKYRDQSRKKHIFMTHMGSWHIF